MARTVEVIHNEMLANIAANEKLAALNSPSKTAIFRLFAYVIAISIWTVETLFDTHSNELTDKLANQKSGTLPWYRTMALAFLYGFDLVTDRDYFDTTGATPEQIEAASIVKYAAVDEATLSSRVIIKIAGETDGVLAPITDPQKEAFEAYIKEIRVAGTAITVINYLPDRLSLVIQIKRDPLVLDDSGMSILNATYPVNEAISSYMKELPFNGELRLSALVDKLQVVPGVLDATVLDAQSAWINPETNGYGDPVQITISTIPVSGYFEVVTFDNIAYVVQN